MIWAVASFECMDVQDLPEAVSAEELSRYLDLKKLDERVYMFEAVSGYDGYVYVVKLYQIGFLSYAN